MRSSSGAAEDRPSVEPRGSLWVGAVDPDTAVMASRRGLGAAVLIPLLVGALIAGAVMRGALLHVLVSVSLASLHVLVPLSLASLYVLAPLGLAFTSVLVVGRTRRAVSLWAAGRARLRRARGPSLSEGQKPGSGRGPGRGLQLEGDHLSFRSAGRLEALLSTSAEFGVTLLATPRRDRAVALLTSASGTFYVGAHFDGDAQRTAAHVLDYATTVSGDDVGLESIAPDGDPLLVAPDDLVALLDTLAARNPSCLGRFVSTDARGAELSLDDRSLCAGAHRIDLDAPLEWRAIIFQEAFGQAVAVYQGTWVRQGGSELVLVCLLPALGPAIFADIDLAGLDRIVGQGPRAPISGLLRDIRLMQATPAQPPPTEQRVAIDRLFMLPVRCALDRAPRASQQPSRARV